MCYDCNRQTKSKLEDENKKNIFYVCFTCLYDEKYTDKETESIVLLRLYNLNDFFLLSHPSPFVLVCSFYSMEAYLK